MVSQQQCVFLLLAVAFADIKAFGGIEGPLGEPKTERALGCNVAGQRMGLIQDPVFRSQYLHRVKTLGLGGRQRLAREIHEPCASLRRYTHEVAATSAAPSSDLREADLS